MKERPVTWLHRLEYLAVQAVVLTFGNLPLDTGANVCAAIARFVGMRTSLRRRAEQNLAFAMPELSEDERKEILLRMFDSFTRTMVEFRHLKRLCAEADRFEVMGLEHLKAAHEAGKGAILTTGHFGNWEMIRVVFARQGWSPALIYRAFNNPTFDAYAMRTMGVIDAPLFHKGKRGSLGMLRHVRAGGCALILTDQRFSRAPYVPFFGKPARTSLGAAEIALNYGAALLPVRCVRIGRTSKFCVTIDAPLPVEGRTAHEVTADINTGLEEWIRNDPGQYFWMHNRWGKRVLSTPAKAPPQ